MLYRLLIVEDEELLRKAMCVMIDWDEAGITVAGAVENGVRAIDFLENNPVDIVVTDIRMPHMDGLELACELKVKYPKVKTVLYSAYSEFQFAQKGIEYGVYGYLLKSQDEDEIAEYFKQMCKKLDEESIYSLRHSTITASKPDMWENRERLMDDLVEKSCVLSEFEECEIQKRAADYKMDLSGEAYMVMLIEIDEVVALKEEIGESGIRRLKKILAEQCLINIEWNKNGYLVSYNETMVIIWNNFEGDYILKITDIKDTITGEIDLFEAGSTITLTVSLGEIVRQISSLCKSYQSACSILLNKFYLGSSQIIYSEQEESGDNLSHENISQYLQKIDKLCYEEKSDEILTLLDKIKDDWISLKTIDRSGVENFCMRVMLVIKESLKKKLNLANYFEARSIELIKAISICETIEAVFVRIKLTCQDIFDEISLANLADKEEIAVHQPKKLVEKAIDYMKENFAMDISLDRVAQYVNVHPVHLSRLFRQETTQTFKSILTQMRIDSAKILLEDLDLRIYEISEKVGYKKPRYFSELFKEVTGRTPLEYREGH